MQEIPACGEEIIFKKESRSPRFQHLSFVPWESMLSWWEERLTTKKIIWETIHLWRMMLRPSVHLCFHAWGTKNKWDSGRLQRTIKRAVRDARFHVLGSGDRRLVSKILNHPLLVCGSAVRWALTKPADGPTEGWRESVLAQRSVQPFLARDMTAGKRDSQEKKKRQWSQMNQHGFRNDGTWPQDSEEKSFQPSLLSLLFLGVPDGSMITKLL